MAESHDTRSSQAGIAAHWLGSSRPRRTRGTCTLDGCDLPHYGRGYCQRHYDAWRAHGTPTPNLPRAKGTTCTATGCTQEARSRGLCRQHYNRWHYLFRRGVR